MLCVLCEERGEVAVTLYKVGTHSNTARDLYF